MASRKDNKSRVLKTGESQRTDGTYQYRYTDSRGKRQTVYAKTLNELREKESKILQASDSELNYEGGQITVTELLDHYLSMRRNLSKGSVYAYTQIINRIKKFSFAHMKICSIKIITCKQFVLKLIDNGYASKTIQDTCVLLKSAFSLAVEEECLNKNPWNFSMDFLDKEKESEKDYALTTSQIESLLMFMQTDRKASQFYDLVVVLLETGMRIGELSGLTFKDVDLKNRLVHITHQVQYREKELYIAKTKTNSGTRSIPLSDKACQAFQNIIKNREILKTEPMLNGYVGFLFVSENGQIQHGGIHGHHINTLANRYNAAHPDAPLRITPHVFRHTFCTRMVYAGMDIKSLQYIMGHKNPNMILKVYAHVDKERSIEAMRSIIAQ